MTRGQGRLYAAVCVLIGMAGLGYGVAVLAGALDRSAFNAFLGFVIAASMFFLAFKAITVTQSPPPDRQPHE